MMAEPDTEISLEPIPDHQRQTCKVCGRRDYFDFHVPDEMWKTIVPPEYQNRVVCLACFDRFAYDRKVDYGSQLRQLYFAGDQASFTFDVVNVV